MSTDVKELEAIPCVGYEVGGRDPDGLVRVTKLNLGCGWKKYKDCVNVDRAAEVSPDVQFDVNVFPWPFKDDTFNMVLCSHLIEHIPAPLPFMQELHRVCAPDAVAVFKLPYGSSDNAWGDPTHVRPYFLDSFGYFSQAAYGGADYGYRGDWMIIERELRMVAGKDLEEFSERLDDLLGMVMTHRNLVEEFKVVVKAVKPIRTPATAREKSSIQFVIPKAQNAPAPGKLITPAANN